MNTKKPIDPGEAFSKLVTEWERGFNALANQVMGTSEYTKLSNQLQDVRLRANQSFQEFMTQNLATANMPTRDDVVRVAEMVQGLAKRLERIEDLLAGSQPRSAPAAGTKSPPRTRKPPRTKPKAPAKSKARS